MEWIERKYHTFWDERIAANYYPSTSQSYIKNFNNNNNNNNDIFSMIINQAHGIGCLTNNSIEIMLPRRCLSDDRRGVNEVLNTRT